MIAASMVDLPDPVCPVTITNLRGARTRSATTGGKPSSSKDGTSELTRRITIAIEPRWE
jgi:hypothetical protein